MKNALKNLVIESREAEQNARDWKFISRQKMNDARAVTRIIQRNEPDFTLEGFINAEFGEADAPAEVEEETAEPCTDSPAEEVNS